MQRWPLELSNFILFMCGWKRALQRCNSDSAKIMNALENEVGACPPFIKSTSFFRAREN